MAWRAEDRAEAKRQREAAAAAAAAARARNLAMSRELAAGLRTAPPDVSVPPGQTFGPQMTPGRVDRLMPPGAATGTPVGPRVGLSFGSVGAPAVGPQASVAPEQFDPSQISNIQFLQGELAPPSAGAQDYSAFVAAARRGSRPTVDQLVASVEAGALTAQQAADVQAMIDSGYIPSDADVRAATAAGMTPTVPIYTPAPGREAIADWAAGAFGGRTRGEQAAIETERVRLGAAPAAGAPAPAPAPATAGQTVTIAGPNGPVTVPVDTLSMGRDPSQPQPRPLAPGEQLTFGERLGAVPDPSMTVVDRAAATPPGDLQNIPIVLSFYLANETID
jgi:hypothetical protein